MSQNLPIKRSLRDFLSLRHPNHLGPKNRNLIITSPNPEKFQSSTQLGQGRCKRIFQGSLTLLASFDFATSCPKIKV